MSRKIGLDFVRSVAILNVLASHFIMFYAKLPHYYNPFGFAGVEIFYVLSGYLIGGLFLKEIDNNKGIVTAGLLTRFWVRRWMRTLPDYYAWLSVFAWYLGMYDWQTLLQYIMFTQNLAWPSPTFFNVSWSLAVEEIFYLLMPTMVFLAFLATRRTRSSFAFAVALLLLMPMILRLTIGVDMPWDSSMRKIVIFRLDAPLWGVLIAGLQRYRPDRFRSLQRWQWFVVGLALSGLTAAYVCWRWRGAGQASYAHPASALDALFLSLISIACALMMPFCSALTCSNRLISTLGFRISLYSYSLYLCHEAVMFWLSPTMRSIPWLAPYAVTVESGLLGAAIVLLVTAGVAALSYHLIEYPMLMLRDRLVPGRQEKVRNQSKIQPFDGVATGEKIQAAETTPEGSQPLAGG